LLTIVFKWLERIHLAAWLVGLAGSALTFLAAAVEGRNPLDVWVLAVVIAAALTIVAHGLITLWRSLRLGRPVAASNDASERHRGGPVYWTLTQSLSWIGFGEPYTAEQWKSDYVSRKLGAPDFEKPAFDAAEHKLFEAFRAEELVAQGKKGKKTHVYEPIPRAIFCPMLEVGFCVMKLAPMGPPK
jgi:hypothetical protein